MSLVQWNVDCPEETRGRNIHGYADGYLSAFSGTRQEERKLPVIGRVSMDLVTLDLNTAPELKEGDWSSLVMISLMRWISPACRHKVCGLI